MSLNNSLSGWIDGPPQVRDDGGLAVVELRAAVVVDGQPHYQLPIIVSRWSGKLRATGAGSPLRYEDVAQHIDITA